MKKSVDELKETMKSDKKELKDKVFMSCSNFELSLTMVAKFREGIEGQGIHGLFKEFNISIEHGIEGTFMFLYKMKPILVLCLKFCFFRLRMNTLTSRGELNWRRTKSGTNNKYEDLTHDEDVHDNTIYNNDGFRILMMVLEY